MYVYKEAGNYFVDILHQGPIATFEVTTANNPTIYQPLILQCMATVVRGSTGTVDIIWTTGNTQIRRVNNVTASRTLISSSVYNDSFILSSLNISDIGDEYQCEVLINSVFPTKATTGLLIPFPGIYICTYVAM